ncbi:Rad2 nuclease [Linnemannia zychae]|nr:Rad2 nuclease [Linnemannia zychae]
MGIQGLLPLLKSIEKPVHLRDYAGKTLAVDGYVWLHKGAFSCAQELCLGQPTQKYVTYFMRRIEMFKFFGVKPYVVFDGGYLPSKARREESKNQALDLHMAGKSKQAMEQFRKCVDVTPEMAYEVIQALKAAQVDFVVAPYEADAQLAYLEKHGIVDGIVTEDSDLLVFGCKKVIFKLDQFGAGTEILFEKFSRVQEVSFQDWTLTEIRHMCILSGCDYLPSLPGMGLKTAQRLLRRYKTFDKVLRHIRMENTSIKIPSTYEMDFQQADLTFLYARVFDPITKSMTHLNPIPDDLKDLIQSEEYHFLGPPLEPTVLQGIAEGRINPIDKTPLSGLMSKRSNHYVKYSYAGKENRHVTKSSLPAGRAINTYFQKTTSTTSTTSSSHTGVQKREIPKSDNAVTTKRRILEPSTSIDSIANISNEDSSSTPPFQKKSIQDTPRTGNIIVESRSRFFLHFDIIDTSEDTDNLTPTVSSTQTKTTQTTQTSQELRISNFREDSGIGMDEASLLFVASSSKAQPSSNHRESLHSTREKTSSIVKGAVTNITNIAIPAEPDAAEEEIAEYKRAEAKVIQGWREKFSNPSQPGRTPGLKRAFLDCGRIPRKSTTVASATLTTKYP